VRALVEAAQGPSLAPAPGQAEAETGQHARRGAERQAGPQDWRQFQP